MKSNTITPEQVRDTMLAEGVTSFTSGDYASKRIAAKLGVSAQALYAAIRRSAVVRIVAPSEQPESLQAQVMYPELFRFKVYYSGDRPVKRYYWLRPEPKAAPMITVAPPTPVTAKDDLSWAVQKLERAWDMASHKGETPIAAYIHDAITLIKRATVKL